MIVAVVEAETATVETVKVPVVDPAATVTVAGTVALVLLELKLTLTPPVAAGPVSVTVPVEGEPPCTDVGLSERLTNVGRLIVSVAVLEVPFSVAVIVEVVVVATATVVIVNVPVVAPAATVTVAGTVALVELEVRPTDTPPVPAAPLRVTVPVEDVPPVRVAGLSETLESAAGVIVRVAV